MNDSFSAFERSWPPQSAKGPIEGHPPFARGWSLFLDIDGTLLEHVERYDQVIVDAPLRSLVARLNRGLDGAIALISGRGVEDVERLFAPLKVPVAGLHGVEHRGADGQLHRHSMDMAALAAVRTLLAGIASSHPGILFEDKGLNLALHFRMAPDLGNVAEESIRAAARQLGHRFEIQKGKMVWEVKPSGFDKGTAIEEFIDEPPFRGRVPVFIGDDLTDEVGFEVVNAHSGHSIKVGPGRTRAGWRLNDAQAVRGFLSALAAHLGERAA